MSTARDAAVEAAAKAIHPTYGQEDADRAERIARAVLDAALPVLLDGLDAQALAEVVAEHFQRGGFPKVQDRWLADAVIAYLRDELGGGS